MIFISWRQLSNTQRIIGSIWAIILLVQMVITGTNNSNTEVASDESKSEVNRTLINKEDKQSEAKTVESTMKTEETKKEEVSKAEDSESTNQQSEEDKKKQEDQQKKQEEEKKKQDQDAVLKFEKEMYALEAELKPYLDSYQKALNGVSEGTVDIFTAYQATENAKEAAEELQLKYFKVDVPKDLPKEVKKELEDAKTDLSTAYYTKSKALGYVLKYFDDQKPSYMSKFQDEINTSDSFIMSGVLKIFKAKELVGLEVVEEQK